MLIVAQAALLALITGVIVILVLRYRQRRIGALGFLFWLLLWISAGTLVLVPDLSTLAAHLVGIGRGVDLVLYFSVILILYLIFRIQVRLEQMDRTLTQIVRTIALGNDDPGSSPE